MGADMTIGICARHVDYHVAEARLKTLSNAVIGAAYNYGDEIDDDDQADYLAQAIEDLSWVYADTRETTLLRIEGKDYVISGGMSWGDYPTDACRPLDVISELGVTELTFGKLSNCDKCKCDIDLDGEGGHIYPDGSVLCPTCEEVTA